MLLNHPMTMDSDAKDEESQDFLGVKGHAGTFTYGLPGAALCPSVTAVLYPHALFNLGGWRAGLTWCKTPADVPSPRAVVFFNLCALTSHF